MIVWFVFSFLPLSLDASASLSLVMNLFEQMSGNTQLAFFENIAVDLIYPSFRDQ